MNFLRLILFPFSLLYGLIVGFRNKLFDWKIISTQTFDLPVISVGNLSVGGTGKTPHVEYLIRLLNDEFKIATLSRGYKRKTKGFILADSSTGMNDIGDEPMQYFTKFPKVRIAVDENRVNGINSLKKEIEELNVVLLDDAYQHRYVKPGLNILLTDFHNLFVDDYLLPTGSLREFRSGAKRADIIVITKTPIVLNPIISRSISEEVKPKNHQKLYFSYVKHGDLKQIPGIRYKPGKKMNCSTILMVAGIANTYPLEDHLKKISDEIEVLKFPDHHQFSVKDVEKIVEAYDNILTENKIIVTTEKDMMRLSNPELIYILRSLPICYLPIEVVMHKNSAKSFNKQILDYVRKDKPDNEIHKN